MRFCIIECRVLRCIFVRSVGVYNKLDHSEIIRVIGGLDLIRQGGSLLHDMRQIAFQVGTDEVVAAGRTSTEVMEARRLRVALVADSDLGFGMARVIQGARTRLRQETHAYRSMAEAMSWITGQVLSEIPAEIDDLLDRGLEATRLQDDGLSVIILRPAVESASS